MNTAPSTETQPISIVSCGLNMVFLIILLVTGASLVWLGGTLLSLGGSAYYLLAGIAMAASVGLIALRSVWGLRLYAVFLAATAIWALWECGLNGWALAPRLGMPLVMGLWLLSPWQRAALGRPSAFRGSRILWSSLAALLLGWVGLLFWWDQPVGGFVALAPQSSSASLPEGDWVHYGNDLGGSHYSPLGQITPANIGNLKPAWVYHTGAMPTGAHPSFEVTPLKIGNRLYFCTGHNDVIALNAETGAELWRHHTHTDTRGIYGLTCRGVSYYAVPNAQGPCAERIYTATIDARLIALDAATGASCSGFGDNGETSLLTGMGAVEKGYYFVTSPPQLVRGKLVVGGWVTDGQFVGEPSGVIRAFDAVTGMFAWAFDTGRPDDHGLPPKGESYTRGTPNSWAPMSADEALGLVYIPTGNATPDYVGMHRRPADEKYSSAVVALDGETGAVRWSFQTTHHDLWDYDVPAQPTLIDIPGRGPALLQPTKRGEIFMLDRRTGKPLASVVERPMPQGGVHEERLAPTQPFSTGLPEFAGAPPSETTMWGLTPIDQVMCRIRFRQARFEGTMTPLNTNRPTITWPGYLGGMDWGGVSVDRARHLMVVNTNGVANYNYLIKRAAADKLGLKPMVADHLGDVGGPAPQMGTPYAAHIAPFLSPLAIPCQQPPYGTVSVVDLVTGKLLWTKPFGTSRDSGPLTLPTVLPIPMGVPNIGGAVATAGGVFFIGATQEHYLRAYETTTGRELWKARLPAGGNATPMSYWSAESKRQFMVIAAGGHGGMLSGQSDALMAYALAR